MTKHSTESESRQLSFLEETSRRDPDETEIVKASREHNFPLQRVTMPDGREMYAVRDWLSGIAQTDNPSRFWADLKKRMKKADVHVYASCVQLPYTASDGKTYQMDYADGQTIYTITQHMGVDTGVRNTVLSYLAQSGVFVDAARRDPEAAETAINLYARAKADLQGKDDAWILVRELGKVTRKQLTAIIVKISPNANLGVATNLGYEGTLGANAKGLNALLGQKPGANPRDGMSRLALAYTMVNEEATRLRLEDYGENEIVHESVVYREIKSVASAIGIQAREMAERLGIDLITGKPLLTGGRQ